MKGNIAALVVIFVSFFSWADPQGSDAPVPIGQPTVFWHNCQWQTYKDGVWTPYGQEASTPVEPSDHGTFVQPGSAPTDRGSAHPQSQRGRNHRLHGMNDRNANAATRMGQSLGEPNVAIGQTTIGIGQSNIGIGQRNGIGQTTIGIGQPTIGIGQPNMAIGQTTIGIGQQNGGIGQPTIGIGQPNATLGQPNTIGQTTIGIGRQTESFSGQRGARRNRAD
jgi:hypothetical protein